MFAFPDGQSAPDGENQQSLLWELLLIDTITLRDSSVSRFKDYYNLDRISTTDTEISREKTYFLRTLKVLLNALFESTFCIILRDFVKKKRTFKCPF